MSKKFVGLGPEKLAAPFAAAEQADERADALRQAMARRPQQEQPTRG